MDQFLNDIKPWLLLSTIIYATIGMLVFGVAFAIFNKLMPFSVRKEIEQDQNTALGIVIGSFLIGLSIIIAAAIHSCAAALTSPAGPPRTRSPSGRSRALPCCSWPRSSWSPAAAWSTSCSPAPRRLLTLRR